jgi:cytoskeletal protein CcmA (bactofilin family)
MWNRNKKEDELPVRPSAPAPTSAELSREGIPMNTFSTRQEPTVRAGAVVGKTLVIHGTISGREDVVVDGRLEGDIDLPENRLTVGIGGHVQGGVKAREIVVFGSVHGNLDASERIEIKRAAKVVGDLKTSRIVMEDESYFKGNVDTMKTDPPKPQPQPQPVAAAPSVTTRPEAQPSLLPGDGKR